MAVRHIAKLNPEDMEHWFKNHPCCPEPGALPILEIVLWQLPDMSGIIRTYNFNFDMLETMEQSKEMGKVMMELLDAIIEKLEALGIIRAMSDEEQQFCKARIIGSNLH